MRWRDVGDLPCSIARTLAAIGDTWTLLLLREAFAGTTTFDLFQERVGASRPIIADRLVKLAERGILERRPYQDRPVRYEYHLTQKGRDLYPILLAFIAWGDRYMDDGSGPPWEFVHNDCGNITAGRIVCTACGESIDSTNVTPQPGPGLLAHLQRLEDA